MKAKLLKVKTPNKMLFIKGKLIRTPLEYIIKFKEELNLLKSSMNIQGIEYDLEDYIPEVVIKKKITTQNIKKNITKKPKKEATTILEKIVDE